MSEPAPESPSTVYAQPWAVRLGFAVIVAFTVIVGLAFMDQSKRAELESVSETTSVGDTAFFVLPDPAKAPGPVAALDGQPLLLATAQPIDLRDTRTRRVGRDVERGLTIYELSDSASPAEKAKLGSGRTLLLKTAVNQYAAVRSAAK